MLDQTWPDPLRALADADVVVRLVVGTDDIVVDRALLRWARGLRCVSVHDVDAAGHDLPLTDPHICRVTLRE